MIHDFKAYRRLMIQVHRTATECGKNSIKKFPLVESSLLM